MRGAFCLRNFKKKKNRTEYDEGISKVYKIIHRKREMGNNREHPMNLLGDRFEMRGLHKIHV